MAKEQIKLDSLVPGTDYVVQVRSVGQDGRKSQWSPSLLFTTAVDSIAPNPPDPATTTFEPSGTSFVLSMEEPTHNTDGSETNDFSYFLVRVFPTGNEALAKHYHVESEQWEFTLGMNKWAFGSPEGDLTVKIWSRDVVGNPKDPDAATPTEKSAQNAAPEWPDADVLTATGEFGSVRLEWEAAVGDDIAEYWVYRDGSVVAKLSGDTLSFSDSDPGAGEHSYHVVAVDAFGQQSLDSETETAFASGYWEEDSTAPAEPTNLTYTTSLENNNENVSTSEITLSWDAPITSADGSAYEDHEGFEVRMSRSSTGPWNYSRVADDRADGTVAATIRYPFEELQPGVEYFFGVRAVDRYGNYSTWLTSPTSGPGIFKAAADSVAPATPANVTASGGIGTISVSWDANSESDLKHYKVYASQTAGFTPDDATNLEDTLDGTITSFPANDGETWYVKVIAVDYSGNHSTASAEVSATAAGTGSGDGVAPDKPTGLGLTTSNYFVGSSEFSRIVAEWTAPTNSDLAGYHVKIQTETEYTATPQEGTVYTVDDSFTSYIFNGLEKEKTYYVSVESIDTSGNVSGYTPEKSILTSGATEITSPTPTASVAVDGPYIHITWDEPDSSTHPDLKDYKITVLKERSDA